MRVEAIKLSPSNEEIQAAAWSFVRGHALLGDVPESVGEITSGALDTIGSHLQGVDLVGGTRGNDSERCVYLLSQTICLIFGFLFCAGFLGSGGLLVHA